MIVNPVRELEPKLDNSTAAIQVSGTSSDADGRLRNGSSGGPGHAELTCHRLRIRDLRFLISSVRQVQLDQPDSQLNASGALASGLRALRPLARNRPATSIAFLADQFAGFLQFAERGPDRRWVATNVGIATSVTNERHILDGLLEFSIKRAGSRSVKRLFARVAPFTELYDAFLACGFEPFNGESIYVQNRVIRGSAVTPGMREQEPADTWAVHQLYHAAAPKHVQYAEAWTSHRWDVGKKGAAGRLWRAFVAEDGYQVIAYAGVRCSSAVAVVDFMYLPERSECVEPLVRAVVGRVGAEAGPTRIYVAARGYQQELQTILLSEGFEQIGEQHLLIKYTTAKVTARIPNAGIGLPSEVLERVPKRVPTYLNRPAREEKPV